MEDFERKYRLKAKGVNVVIITQRVTDIIAIETDIG